MCKGHAHRQEGLTKGEQMSEVEDAWVWNLTIGDVLRETARRNPTGDALVFPRLSDHETHSDEGDSFRISYAQYDALVDETAKAMMSLGVKQGDHVGVWATNWPRWAIVQFAAARIGAVLVTINPAYRTDELSYVLKQSEVTTLFVVRRFRTSDYFGMLQQLLPELDGSGTINSDEYPSLRRIVCLHQDSEGRILNWDQFASLSAAITDGELAQREESLAPTDAINIQYTSGTTGFPKGATLTHRNILVNAFLVGAGMNLTDADRMCVPVPLYHCFGCVYGTLIASVFGAALVIPNEYYAPVPTVDAIRRERCTVIYGVPTMFIAMMEAKGYDRTNMQSLRTGIVAGSPCPIELMKRIVSEMGAEEITIVYGLTENSPGITQTRSTDELKLRVETVGRPLDGIDVKIVDPDTGAELGDNEQGELCSSGHGVMLGYYNMPDMTAQAIDTDGWLHSGDLAVRLPNGYYRITGRMKDMICRGGENIYPREIEEFLYTLPEIKDVAVVGIPDPKFVEEIAAWVVLHDGCSLTDDELRRRCRESISHYKIPRQIRFVDAFPMTVTGKIQKFRIREMMIEELGLEEVDTA
jgi:fatty-acyl-CoA synthase